MLKYVAELPVAVVDLGSAKRKIWIPPELSENKNEFKFVRCRIGPVRCGMISRGKNLGPQSIIRLFFERSIVHLPSLAVFQVFLCFYCRHELVGQVLLVLVLCSRLG